MLKSIYLTIQLLVKQLFIIPYTCLYSLETKQNKYKQKPLDLSLSFPKNKMNIN